jgi:hypothetical protein
MGTRLVNWARHKRLVAPIVCWLFPVDEGTHPNQRDVEPQVSLKADSIDRMRDALLDAVREGLRAAGRDPSMAASHNITEWLQADRASVNYIWLLVQTQSTASRHDYGRKTIR